MLSVMPVGETPVSNSTVWAAPCFSMVTSAEKPCSARRLSAASPDSKKRTGTVGAPGPPDGRLAAPSSRNSASDTLSTSVVMLSESTGSSVIVCIGSRLSVWWRTG